MSKLVEAVLEKKSRIVKKVSTTKVVEASAPTPEIAIGSYVRAIKPETGFGEGTSMTIVREHGIIGRVITRGLGCWVVEYITSPLFQGFRGTYADRTLEFVPNDIAEECIKKQVEENKKILEKKLEKVKEIVEPKRIALMERDDYDIASKPYLNSNYNYVCLNQRGTKLQEGKEYKLADCSVHPAAACCSLTKNVADQIIHIPKEWASYYGYSIIDVKAWIQFLSKCDLGFTGFYTKKVRMKDIYPSIRTNIPTYPNNNNYTHEEMEAFEVLSPSTGNNMRNYMNFICVRYLYNMQYFTIPFIAMQIKKGIGDKITFWEALLLAHCNYPYHGYYCLTSNVIQTDRKVFSTPQWNLALPTTENTVAKVTAKLTTSQTMNTSFVYTNMLAEEKLKGYDPAALIRAKDYAGLYKFLEICRTI